MVILYLRDIHNTQSNNIIPSGHPQHTIKQYYTYGTSTTHNQTILYLRDIHNTQSNNIIPTGHPQHTIKQYYTYRTSTTHNQTILYLRDIHNNQTILYLWDIHNTQSNNIIPTGHPQHTIKQYYTYGTSTTHNQTILCRGVGMGNSGEAGWKHGGRVTSQMLL